MPDPVISLTNPPQTGADVSGLQRYLQRMGLYAGAIDGVYGPLTAAAVEKFQYRNDLMPNGVVNAETWKAIGRSESSGPRLTSTPAGRSEGITLIVDVPLALLIVYRQGEILAVYPVAVGKTSTPTPQGSYCVNSLGKWGGGFGSRWMGLNVPWGRYGIHGTNKPWSIGGFESHGCVRMLNKHVEEIYHLVDFGTPVHIIGDPFFGVKILVPGDKGSPVFFLQRRLRQLGFYRMKPDGYFGSGTKKAVETWQEQAGLRKTGRVGWAEIQGLRLRPEE